MRKHRQGELVCVSWRSRLVRKALPPASGRPACRGPVLLPLRAGYGRPGFGLHLGNSGTTTHTPQPSEVWFYGFKWGEKMTTNGQRHAHSALVLVRFCRPQI
jgi:hypothetical protein